MCLLTLHDLCSWLTVEDIVDRLLSRVYYHYNLLDLNIMLLFVNLLPLF